MLRFLIAMKSCTDSRSWVCYWTNSAYHLLYFAEVQSKSGIDPLQQLISANKVRAVHDADR